MLNRNWFFAHHIARWQFLHRMIQLSTPEPQSVSQCSSISSNTSPVCILISGGSSCCLAVSPKQHVSGVNNFVHPSFNRFCIAETSQIGATHVTSVASILATIFLSTTLFFEAKGISFTLSLWWEKLGEELCAGERCYKLYTYTFLQLGEDSWFLCQFFCSVLFSRCHLVCVLLQREKCQIAPHKHTRISLQLTCWCRYFT